MLSSIASYNTGYHGDIDGALSLTMARSARRGPWLPEEDQALLQLVRTQGANNWVRISQQIQHRSPKQCRERYHQNLKPSLKHDPISAQEGEIIERLVQEMGKRWAEIARRLGNRSDNAVKNWWNGSVNRRRRNPAQSTTGFKQVGSRLQPVPFTLATEHNYSQDARPVSIPSIKTSIPQYSGQQESDQAYQPTSLAIPGSTLSCYSSTTGVSPSSPSCTHTLTGISPASQTSTVIDGTRLSMPNPQRPPLRPELPPLRSSSNPSSYGESVTSAREGGPISPALSDTSQRHAPSLVSDSHSLYSISPRTISTPRPGIPASVEIRSSSWSDNLVPAQYHAPSLHYKSSPSSDSVPKFPSMVPLDSTLPRYRFSASQDDKFKDSRMNVSTLLQ